MTEFIVEYAEAAKEAEEQRKKIKQKQATIKFVNRKGRRR